jgi:oligopeptide transport system permease protein
MAATNLGRDAESILARKPRSLWRDSLQRLLRNRLALLGGSIVIAVVLMALFAPLISPFGFAEQDLDLNNAVPPWMMWLMPEGAENYARITPKFPLGADTLGRDLLSRTIYGARISLAIAVVAASVSLLVGTVYGTISGYIGGRADNFMMRIVDFLYGFPFLIVVILLQTYFKAVARRGASSAFANVLLQANEQMGGMLLLFIALGLVNWIGMARIARGQVLSYKEKEFVEAARSVGARHSRIIFRHLVPNVLGPLIVAETLAIPGYIFTEAFLSFIGLGVDPPTPSWGIMISQGVQNLRSYPLQTLVPAIALSITTLAFNFLGDGLRDAFDPRMAE